VAVVMMIMMITIMRIFGYKRDEVTEGWWRLHNEELHNMLGYSPENTIKMIK
jgi:lactate dehydrogenase-like 2-hydroxyacid dehydrogenase